MRSSAKLALARAILIPDFQGKYSSRKTNCRGQPSSADRMQPESFLFLVDSGVLVACMTTPPAAGNKRSWVEIRRKAQQKNVPGMSPGEEIIERTTLRTDGLYITGVDYKFGTRVKLSSELGN